MVADAQALHGETKPKSADPTIDTKFRGSFSGYEKDDLFYNPDGAYPGFFKSPYVFGLDFDDDGRSAAAVDIDGDGDLDLALLSLQGLRLMENTMPRRHFARLRLAATKLHPLALGARVRLTSGGVTQQDYVRITDGFQTQVPVELHFGLADAAAIDLIEVTWPSGDVQQWKSLPADRLLRLEEGRPDAAASALPAWPDDSRPRVLPSFNLDATLTRLEGGSARVAQVGRPAVVNFWAPWCQPCKNELPALSRLAAAYASEAQFIGVSAETKDLDSVKAAVRDWELGYPQFVADDAVLRSFFGDKGEATLPSTFVFDGNGKLRRVFRREIEAGELKALLDSFREETISAADLLMAGMRLVDRQEFDEAMKHLDRLLALDPESAKGHFHRGRAQFGKGDARGSIVSLKRSLELDPGNGLAWYNLGVAYKSMGSIEEALANFVKSVEVLGDRPEMLLAMGVAAAESNRIPMARDAFERAVKADPKVALSWYQKGILHAMLKEMDDARACMEKALKLDPEMKEARRFLGR